jgi:hypothetical protein
MTISYTTPPARPEINPSSPFYATLMSYVPCIQGKGLPRDVVHNTLPRGTPGVWGTQFGERPTWETNAFPFAGPPDGTTGPGGYDLRGTVGTRMLSWAYGGDNQLASHSDWDGHSVTYFAVFRVDELPRYTQSVVPILGSSSCYGNTGTSMKNSSIEGLALVCNTPGTVLLGFVEDNSFAYGLSTTSAVITKGHWYAAAVAMTSTTGTGPGGGNLAQARRIYLHDLTTDTRLCGNKTDHQTITWSYGSFTDQGYQGRGPVWNNDLVLFPGSTELSAVGGGGTCGDWIGAVHVLGMDGQFWDDSGWFFAVPSAFGASDPFSTFVANIYGMINGTYVTGSVAPTVIAAANGSNTDSGGNPYQYANQSNWVVGSTTVGVPTTLKLVAVGDAVQTAATHTYLEISVTRPQGAPAAITSYSLYGSTSGPLTTLDGTTLIATNPVASTTYPEVFHYVPPDTHVRYFVVTATDGTNTYTYPGVEASLKLKAPLRIAMLGNSYGTTTGGGPQFQLSRAGAAYGCDCPVLNFNFDGSSIAQWAAGGGQGLGGSPHNPFSENLSPLDWSLQTIAAEVAANGGTPYDVALVWLIENDVQVGGIAAWLTSFQTLANAILASGHVSHVVPVPYGQRLFQQLPGEGEAYSTALSSIDNGTTIRNIGMGWYQLLSNYGWSLSGNHPSPALASVESTILVNDVMTQILYPTGGGGTVPSAADVRYGTAVGATTGTCHVPAAGDVRFGTSVDATTGTCHVPTASQVLTTVAVDATTGNVVLPTTAQVLSGVSFGASSASTGTVVLPSASSVLTTATFGPGSTTTGTVVLPTAAQVITTATFGAGSATTGTVALPTAAQVESGVTFGPGSATTGTYAASSGALPSNGLDSIVIETGINARQALSLILATLAGKITGQDANAPIIAAAGLPTVTRISATTDNSGNRPTVTLTPPA